MPRADLQALARKKRIWPFGALCACSRQSTVISCYQKLELQWNFVESIGYIGILFKILCIFNSEWLNLKSDKLHMKHWIRIITVESALIH